MTRCSAAVVVLGLALAVTVAVLSRASEPALTASGIVISVDSPALGVVNSFVLRTEAGELLEFRVGTLEADRGTFPAVHLREHMITAQGVAVAYRMEGDTRVAYRLADANWVGQ